MIWIELMRAKEISGIQYFAGYRRRMPRSAAMAMIANGDARQVSGPHENRGGAGYPVSHERYGGDDTDTTTSTDDSTEGDDSDETPTLDEPRDLLTSVDGIGDEKAEELVEQLDDIGLLGAPLDELLAMDLTDLNGVGPATASDIRDEIDERI